MRKTGAYIVLIIAAFLLGGCGAPEASYSVTLMGSEHSDVAVAAGKITADRQGEFGVNILAYEQEDQTGNYDAAVGVYMARWVPLPQTNIEDTLAPFVGISPMLDTDSGDPLVKPFVGVALYPYELVSLVAAYEYYWTPDSVDNPGLPQDEDMWFVGMRILNH